MVKKEYFVSGIRQQHDVLGALIGQLENSQKLTTADCGLYERTTQDVEKNLKKLRKLISEELIKEVQQQNPESLLE